MATTRGGEKLAGFLDDIAAKIRGAGGLRVGFLEGATYPDTGIPVAYIASIQEFGAVIDVDAHDQTIYRKLNADGSFAKNGQFVRKAKSNFATTHAVEAHSINIPARPFFRTMVAQKSPGWGVQLGKVAKAADYDMDVTLDRMGELIKGQLQESIRDWRDPGNAASTIRAKGFDDPLIDTGHMLDSVDYEVLK